MTLPELLASCDPREDNVILPTKIVTALVRTIMTADLVRKWDSNPEDEVIVSYDTARRALDAALASPQGSEPK